MYQYTSKYNKKVTRTRVICIEQPRVKLYITKLYKKSSEEAQVIRTREIIIAKLLNSYI